MKKTYNPKKDINNPEHPSRQKAIEIMEYIAEYIGKPDIFDGENWYLLEDRLTNIINRKD